MGARGWFDAALIGVGSLLFLLAVGYVWWYCYRRGCCDSKRNVDGDQGGNDGSDDCEVGLGQTKEPLMHGVHRPVEVGSALDSASAISPRGDGWVEDSCHSELTDLSSSAKCEREREDGLDGIVDEVEACCGALPHSGGADTFHSSYLTGPQIAEGSYGEICLCTPRPPAAGDSAPNWFLLCKTIRKSRLTQLSAEHDWPIRFSRDRLVREVEALHRMTHHARSTGTPPVVPILHAVFEDEGTVWIVMRRCRGPSLLDALVRWGRPLQEAAARHVLRQVADAVRSLHDTAHVAHGDLKLENVLLDAPPGTPWSDRPPVLPPPTEWHLVLVDLGSTVPLHATLSSVLQRRSEDPECALLSALALAWGGSAHYLSPERADIQRRLEETRDFFQAQQGGALHDVDSLRAREDPTHAVMMGTFPGRGGRSSATNSRASHRLQRARRMQSGPGRSLRSNPSHQLAFPDFPWWDVMRQMDRDCRVSGLGSLNGRAMDAWALGVILTVLLTHRLPFSADEDAALTAQRDDAEREEEHAAMMEGVVRLRIVWGERDPMRDIGDALSRKGRSFLRKLLHRNPAERLVSLRHPWLRNQEDQDVERRR